MHKVEAKRSGELFVKNMLILHITLQWWSWKHMIIIKTYKVKIIR